MGWWHRYPTRLTEEVERLAARGFTTTFDPSVPVEADFIEISATYPVDGRDIHFTILYPELYPYFRPRVSSEDISIAHHQNPFDQSLCLLGRNTDYWQPDMHAADLIADQLPKLLESEVIAEQGGIPNEELQAEPWTEYLSPDPSFGIAWNADINVPIGSHGSIELSYIPHAHFYRAYVSKVTHNNHVVFTESMYVVPDAKSKMSVPFIRIDSTPPYNLQNLATLIEAHYHKYNPLGSIRRFTDSIRGTLFALFYPEETAHRENGLGLVFVLFTKTNTNNVQARYIKSYRVGGVSLIERLGSYGNIRGNKVLLVGFGSLGSTIAVDLCKLGIKELMICDRDVFEPGNTARHYFGMQYYGVDKVKAAEDALRSAYPNTKIRQLSYKLGDSGEGARKKTEELYAGIEGCDFIVDCTTERGVQQFLSDEAWYQDKRYYFVEAYPGMLGGFIGLIEPKSGPCFECFLQSLVDGSTTMPPLLNSGYTQPVGCAEPTFVGTPFDAETISAAAVRLIFSTMVQNSSYPKSISNFYRIVLSENDLLTTKVVVEPINLRKREGCEKCGDQ